MAERSRSTPSSVARGDCRRDSEVESDSRAAQTGHTLVGEVRDKRRRSTC